MIEDVLARAPSIRKCADFRDTAEILTRIGFKMFLGTTPSVANVQLTNDLKVFSVVIEDKDNPLTEYVELPPELNGLAYCSMLCGVIRGALEMVQLQVECAIVKDSLLNDPATEIRVKLIKVIAEERPPSED